MPQVNPPQAAGVLAGPTALEVAGNPEPPEVKALVASPVAKSAEQLAAESAPRSRRTAAVVQVELDAALLEINRLQAQINSGPCTKGDLGEANEVCDMLQDEVNNRNAEILVLAADLEKAHKRNDSLAIQCGEQAAQIKLLVDEINANRSVAADRTVLAAPGAPAGSPVTTEQLRDELTSRGWIVALSPRA
jgi:hypothetical protein